MDMATLRDKNQHNTTVVTTASVTTTANYGTFLWRKIFPKRGKARGYELLYAQSCETEGSRIKPQGWKVQDWQGCKGQGCKDVSHTPIRLYANDLEKVIVLYFGLELSGLPQWEPCLLII